MASVLAPRPRTKSTVRLVSVVVPDWLMAITNVSDILSGLSCALILNPLNSDDFRASIKILESLR